jgi:hypothetical protein
MDKLKLRYIEKKIVTPIGNREAYLDQDYQLSRNDPEYVVHCMCNITSISK